jgi:signal transduction histidine kinase
MKAITVILVQLSEANRETALQAARQVWPHAAIATARSVAEAAREAGGGTQLLVLGGADEADAGLAAQTLDGADLPRWAVVCLGGGAADVAETVDPADWNVPFLARVFRSTVLQHDLLRENLQLRGDLKTIARRIVHDARTPLGCIHTVCELLRDLPPENADSLRESTDIVRASTAEMSRLIDRVSFMIRASIDPVPPVAFAMGPVVDGALRQLQTELEGTAKKVRQPAQWPEAEGVPAWTETIWTNLIHNAVVHGARTGTIQLGWTRSEGFIRFWVSSPGLVPAMHRERLFRRFNQLHQTPSAGLGLAFVERLTALQGGETGYETGEDSRAIFHFTLRGNAAPRENPTRAASLLADRA